MDGLIVVFTTGESIKFFPKKDNHLVQVIQQAGGILILKIYQESPILNDKWYNFNTKVIQELLFTMPFNLVEYVGVIERNE